MKELTLSFAALLALLALSVGVSFLPLGASGWVVGIGVASLKAGLVVVVFMEMSKRSWESKAAAWAGVLWLCFLFGLVLLDYVYVH